MIATNSDRPSISDLIGATERGAPRATPSAGDVRDAIARVEATLAPVWPLEDYVAVNPFLGLTDMTFAEARERLGRSSDCDPLMPLSHFAERLAEGAFTEAHVALAVRELQRDRAVEIEADEVLARLAAGRTDAADARAVRTIVARHDAAEGSTWLDLVREEIGRHLGAHYDRGQAAWPSPFRDLAPFAAWRRTLRHDRRADLVGLGRVRGLARVLPDDPREAVAALLPWIAAPTDALDDYLLALLLETPGWAAWARHRSAWSGEGDGSDVAALLAIRLAYEVAFAEARGLLVERTPIDGAVARERRLDGEARLVLQSAVEVAYRERLIADLDAAEVHDRNRADGTPDAQWVMCIDVRSERLRRHLEAANPSIETHGFAGFFGQPIAIERADGATPQVPVLVKPGLTVREEVRGAEARELVDSQDRRRVLRFARLGWKRFRSAGVAALGFVEACGLLFLPRLVARAIGRHPAPRTPRTDGVDRRSVEAFGPTLDGVPLEQRVELAAGLLRGIGIAEDLARVVVLCGHASTSANNPLRASLDCGACGGHSGEPNARFAAALLRDPAVRRGLESAGIHVPEDTLFLAATHDTTTDEVRFHDLDLVPEAHVADVTALRRAAAGAGHRTRAERLPSLRAMRSDDVWRRARDWAEVRPEWGLAGNAAFVIGPRAATRGVDLDGRAFLHSYRSERDPDGAVLESILTAPLVVASWINLQYYASTVDPTHFGSGSKTLHNVVGGFGVLSGGGGDLGFGLPLESVADAEGFSHEPQRLLAVVHAPRERVARIVRAHVGLCHLVTNGWVQLVVRDGGRSWRLDAHLEWRDLGADAGEEATRPVQIPAADPAARTPVKKNGPMTPSTDQTSEIEVTRILDQAKERGGGRLERIVVVEDDEEVRARLEAACHDGVVVTLPRATWSPGSGPLREVLEWTVRNGCTSRVLLVDVTARRDEDEADAGHVLERSRAAARRRRVKREALIEFASELHADGGAAARLAAAGTELMVLMQHPEAGCVSVFEPDSRTLEVVAAAGA